MHAGVFSALFRLTSVFSVNCQKIATNIYNSFKGDVFICVVLFDHLTESKDIQFTWILKVRYVVLENSDF